MYQILKNIFSRKLQKHPSIDEDLRIEFKARYHNFRLLLNANKRALEAIARIEQALRDMRPFGMPFVRANCTTVSVEVFRMIRNLEELAPGKYKGLYARFNDIQHRIDGLLSHKKPLRDKRFVIPLSSINKGMADLVGTKMANLGEIKNRFDVAVPDGFAITSAAYQRYIEHNDLQVEIDRRFQAVAGDDIGRLYQLSAEVQQLIVQSEIPDDLANAIMEAYLRLNDGQRREIRVALRSSALGEDTKGKTFAGQYHSELNVGQGNIIQAYKKIVASKYSLPAITYRMNRGLKDDDFAMCVGCMVMIDAESGGVIYSRNPIDFQDDSIYINAVWGLPKPVIDGSVAADLFSLSRKKPISVISQDIKSKESSFRCFPQEGQCGSVLSKEKKDMPSIGQEQAVLLAELAVMLESYYDSPQDIEWVISHDGTTYILQCRSLQQIETAASTYSEKVVRPEPESVLIRGGIAVSPGLACGSVFLVDRGSDMVQFPKGGILVTKHALPRWAPLLNRAAAVITEQGGVAGHLATVARELGIPALFSVSGVMQTLRTGDQITVDTAASTIYEGRVIPQLSDSARKKNFIEGSPVYNTLKEASRQIVPLNLLDPDFHEFAPKNCRTLHDIIRFIHEKSVQAIFNFGKEHGFSERASKQLFYNVPMKWRVLNLDDGFGEAVDGKYVKLDNIVSNPMLALWEGIVAIPWEGPPPIDTKGFMSVMFQATTNKARSSGRRSFHANQNYFLISKNFCNMTSRLGFHFSIVETVMGDHADENYVSFQFKGGGADYERRLKRLTFLKEILEEQGFAVDIKEDNLFARLEGYEKDFLRQKLKILGYLTINSRQLDMIMSNSSMVSYYRSKIRKDIRYLVHS
ncbi:MAG: PEP/pyruvate-binding domain-containing protein [Desulfobacterales bacterium]